MKIVIGGATVSVFETMGHQTILGIADKAGSIEVPLTGPEARTIAKALDEVSKAAK